MPPSRAAWSHNLVRLVSLLLGLSLYPILPASHWYLAPLWISVVLFFSWVTGCGAEKPWLATSYCLFFLAWSIKMSADEIRGVGWAIIGLTWALLTPWVRGRDQWFLVTSSFLASGLHLFSGSAGGADPMRDWLIGMGVDPMQVESVVIAIRKTIHVLFYAGLTGTFALGFVKRWSRTWVAVPLGWCAIHATFDEFSQTLADNRTGQFSDFLIDLVGGGCALIVVVLILRKRTKAGLSATESSPGA